MKMVSRARSPRVSKVLSMLSFTALAALSVTGAANAKSTDSYTIKNLHSGKCVDTRKASITESNKNTLVQSKCTIADDWNLVSVPNIENVPMYQVVNRRSGLCMTALNSQPDNSPVAQLKCDSTSTKMLWKMTKFNLITPTGTVTAYRFVSVALDKKALIVSKASLLEGASLVTSIKPVAERNDGWVLQQYTVQ